MADYIISSLASSFRYITEKSFEVHPTQCAKALGIGLAVYIPSKIIYALFFSPLRNIPGPLLARITPLYEILHLVFKAEASLHKKNYKKYGNIYVYGPNKISLGDISDCRRVFGTHKFIKGPEYKVFSSFGEALLTTSNPKTSHARRRQIGPVFTKFNLDKMEQTILDRGILSIKSKINSLIEEGAGGESKVAKVNYHKMFSLVGLDIIGTLGIGKRLRTLENNDFKIIEWVDAFIYASIVKFTIPITNYFPFSLLSRSLNASANEFVRFSSSAIDDREREISESKKGDPKKSDILQAFIDSKCKSTDCAMTRDQITSETIFLLIGGIDTIANTMAWTVHYLMLYPEAYRKVVSEVRGKYAPDHLIKYAEGHSSLPYLEACIYESMRIRPAAAPALPRVSPEGGATFQGHFIPAGTTISPNIPGVHHNKDIWDNPKQFRPERFLEDQNAKHLMLPFSTGVRICPGRNLAWVEMITILANLIKDYNFAPPADSLFRTDLVGKHGLPSPMPSAHALVLKPRYPERDCWVLVSKASS